MEKNFNLNTGEKVNIIKHTLEQKEKWPTLKMYIGTDSQDYGKITRYVTVVVYRYGTKGAHFIYLKDEVPTIRDMYVRLYGEGVRTIEAAQMVMDETFLSFDAIEFDYNYIPKWASNKLISSIGGWAKALNTRVVFKNSESHIMMATKAADQVCRHSELYR